MLYRHPLWPKIIDAIARLTDFLALGPAIIDHQRRRFLDYRELLPDAEWNRIYDMADFGCPDPVIVGQLVRSWLYERLSMRELSTSPFAIGLLTEAHRRARFVGRFTPGVRLELEYAARRFLAQQGINDEPVSWSPPLALISDIELPGPDPSSVPIDQLRRIVRDTKVPITLVVKHFGVTTPVIRHLLESSPQIIADIAVQ